ncbi:MAG: HDOD domain-containing protein [Propionivibrio sp.]|uniref:HDOD domain-containing protein n=1 Tax=Candidatus Propionivibrio dominans TaxID=2954373 RepID=A0A9D7FCJ4_9RHOO|nr:HDOD domain-containing protein [Candidatus Propionivibrio dominans]
MSNKIGRFEIVRELGRGAQSVVYLARDPHLQREVAIKTLHFSQPDPQKNQQLLAEARLVSQLRHPNIIPIFEAGEEQGDVYLVFEFVPGKNLGDYLKVSGRLTPVKAIAILHPVLDAIAHAHAAGIVHRDLKPNNILIDSEGMSRVMDFGIAAHVEAPTNDAEALMGSPAYMAPEYIIHRESSERTDVFSAGLVFYELLTGERAVPGDNVYEVMNRVANEDIRLPAQAGIELDDPLASVLYKAIARDPQQRFASVVQLREALDNYLEPEEPVASTDTKQSTIDFLIRRMRHKSDFPALSESVSTINKITESDKGSISNLSNMILKDFSLTNKILRLVNSVHYRQAGGGSISTISRAVLVLGFDAVRNITITVMLFEHLQNKANANHLKEEFLHANLAAILARDIGEKTSSRDLEQVFICSMFHNLGRLLSQFYFPDESEEIKRAMEQKPCSEEAAAVQVLGISFEDLGIGIARTWGFPNLIVNSMRKLPAGNVRKANTVDERMRVLSAFANELCTMISDAQPEQQQLHRVKARFGENIALSEQALRETMEKSFLEVSQFAGIIGINLKQSAFGRQMKMWTAKSEPAALVEAQPATAGDSAEMVLSELAPAGAPGSPAVECEVGTAAELANCEVILMAGIQDISNTLVEDFKLNDVLRIILETMYRAKGFKRVILCVRDARSNSMLGRFGFGPDAPEMSKRFNFSLTFTPDIFHAALSKGVDILISDTNDPKIASRIPEWYRKGINAGTFVIFPLCIKGNPVAMIYSDADHAGEIVIPEKELSLLRTLRNQALLAIKQSS